jgi:large conductance mechanosensitive channel
MRGVLKEFKEFIAHGNLIDLAVAVVIGTAFAALIKSLVEDLITPIIAAVFGKPDFSNLVFTINGSGFRYGSFLNAVITFVSIAAAVFFLIVKPMNMLTARISEGKEPTIKDCPECLSEIPAAATRCAHCTTELPAAA